jgi:hypothetical protein
VANSALSATSRNRSNPGRLRAQFALRIAQHPKSAGVT